MVQILSWIMLAGLGMAPSHVDEKIDTPTSSLPSQTTWDIPVPPKPEFPPGTDLTPRFENDKETGFGAVMRTILSVGSDRAFPRFISPSSNPILAKDPRSLTEARLFGTVTELPDNHPWGSSANYHIGRQLKIAWNKRWEFYLDRMGYEWQDQQLGFKGGWMDIGFGGKYQFFRDVENQALASIAVRYDIPSGSTSVFHSRDHGSVGVIISAAKEFCCDWHVIGNVGAQIPVGDRTDHGLTFVQVHVDRRIAEWLYPLVELNWYHLNQTATQGLPGSYGLGDPLFSLPLTDRTNSDLCTIALGAKAALNRNAEIGLVYEKSLTGGARTLDQRLMLEMTLRY